MYQKEKSERERSFYTSFNSLFHPRPSFWFLKNTNLPVRPSGNGRSRLCCGRSISHFFSLLYSGGWSKSTAVGVRVTVVVVGRATVVGGRVTVVGGRVTVMGGRVIVMRGIT